MSAIGKLVLQIRTASTRNWKRIYRERLAVLISAPEEACVEIDWHPGPVDFPEPFDFDCPLEIFKRALERVRRRQKKLADRQLRIPPAVCYLGKDGLKFLWLMK